MARGDGQAPVVEELTASGKHLGSMLSKNFDDSDSESDNDDSLSVIIMARISRLAWIALTKLQLERAKFGPGTRRVALESKKIAYESLVLSLLLYYY
jgi:hypothetical protein